MGAVKNYCDEVICEAIRLCDTDHMSDNEIAGLHEMLWDEAMEGENVELDTLGPDVMDLLYDRGLNLRDRSKSLPESYVKMETFSEEEA